MKALPLTRLIGINALLLALLFIASGLSFASEPAAALQGSIRSQKDGLMEGVIVSAKRPESTITVSVVSNKDGEYRFPQSRMPAGSYELSVRATGYELPAANIVKINDAQTASVNLELSPVEDISAQLTNAEWMASMPGADREKRSLLTCVTCHTLERVVKSKYSREDFLTVVLPRMQSYVNQSMPGAPQIRKGARLMEEQGEDRVNIYREMGEFLEQVNLHDRSTWAYPLKTFPRPSGEATRVIYTEYGLPRPLLQAHDVIVTGAGQVWYSSFGEQVIGRLDPATGAVKEYEVDISKPEFPKGILAIREDREGQLWIGNMYQAAIARFDPETGKFEYFRPPPKDNLPSTQLNQVSPYNRSVDGKVWAQNSGFAGVHRFDVKTGEVETWAPFKDSKLQHNIYDVISDSKNNAFFTDFRQQEIGRIDAKTGQITFYSFPTKGGSPRRGTMDDQDRLWVGEYRGHKIGMLDTRTGEMKEWLVPTPYSAPYDAMKDRNDYVWTSSMTTDKMARLNLKDNQFTEYLLPRSTNVRRVFVQDDAPEPIVWIGNNHGASIVKVEPLQ